jgi:hypothetical protein
VYVYLNPLNTRSFTPDRSRFGGMEGAGGTYSVVRDDPVGLQNKAVFWYWVTPQGPMKVRNELKHECSFFL